jgi:hypothetical protein
MPVPYLSVDYRNNCNPFPDWIDHLHLAANVAQSYTVPTWAKSVVLGSTTTYYMAGEGHTAAVPTGNINDGSGVIPSTGGFLYIERMAGKTISFIAPAACDIGIMVYS